jgi:hypothetical protein
VVVDTLGLFIGDTVGESDRLNVGFLVGEGVGVVLESVGDAVGLSVGNVVVDTIGLFIGDTVGESDRLNVGSAAVGKTVGESEGDDVGTGDNFIITAKPRASIYTPANIVSVTNSVA